MAEAQLDLLAPHEPDSRFVIRKSVRARYMSIHVGGLGVVEVVVPRSSRPREVEQFVRLHRTWIDRALAELEKTHPPIDRSMPQVIALPAVDEKWLVDYSGESLAEKNDTVFVPAKQHDRPRCRQHLHQWLKQKAREHFVPQLRQLADERGFEFKRVQVRGQRTRWGSYSSSGTLSINFCLLFLQPELVEHLMLHELCHTREMSHSRRFWQLLNSHQPGYKAMERRLDVGWIDVPGWVGLH